MKNENHPQWKGDKVSLPALHAWVRRHKPKPKLCEDCGKVPPIDLANISQKYKRDINDFEWLCRKCHMTKDGRLKRTKKTQFKNGQQIRLGKGHTGKVKRIISEKVKKLWQNPEYRKHMSDVHKKLTIT